MTKPKPYQFTNHENYRDKEVLLDKIADDKFQVLELGKFKPIMVGHYVLVEDSIAELLNKLIPEQILSTKKITIWRNAANETCTNTLKLGCFILYGKKIYTVYNTKRL